MTPFSGVRLRIVSVSPVPISADSRTLKQAASLARTGFESIVIAAGRVHAVTAAGVSSTEPTAPAPGTARRFAWIRDRDLWGFIHVPLFLCWLVLFAWRNFFKILFRIPKADLYILHEYSGFFAVWLRSRIHKAPFIYDAHDLYNDLVPEADRLKFDQNFLVPFGRLVERLCVTSASEVFTVSYGLAAALKRNYGIEATVLFNAHDARIDAVNVKSARSTVGLAADTPLIVTVGNRKHGQSLSMVGRTMSLLPVDFHWAFVGAGYSIDLFGPINPSALSRIHLFGRQPSTSVVPFIRSATIAVMLYQPLTENFDFALPNGFFQCIAAHLPQIFSPLTEVSQLAETHCVGVQSALLDADELAESIIQLSQAVRTGEWEKGLDDACQRLSWAGQEKVFLARVDRFASRKGGTGNDQAAPD